MIKKYIEVETAYRIALEYMCKIREPMPLKDWRALLKNFRQRLKGYELYPDHYKSGKYECIEVMRDILTEEQMTGFCLGNALEYLWRAGKKNDFTEDIRKAVWYLNYLTDAQSEDSVKGDCMKEVNEGEWIVHYNDPFPAESTEECSICHVEQYINGNSDNYCPNCGAKMKQAGRKDDAE